MPWVKRDECIACGSCGAECPQEAITIEDGIAKIDLDKCINCGACNEVCPVEAIIDEQPPDEK